MPPSPPSPRVDARRARTRRRLLEATLDLLITTPIEALTIQAVTTQADVGFGTFYLYFPSKEHLLEEAFLQLVTRVDDGLSRALGDVTDPVEAFAVAVRLIVASAANDPHLGVLWRGYFRAGSQAGVLPGEAARRMVERGVSVGRFRVADIPLSLAACAAVVASASERVIEIPEGARADFCSTAAIVVLQALGVPISTARRISWRPLKPDQKL